MEFYKPSNETFICSPAPNPLILSAEEAFPSPMNGQVRNASILIAKEKVS